MKRDHVDVLGTGKNMWESYVRFFMSLKIKKVASKKLSQTYLKHTTCKDLGEHAMKIINYEEKEMIPLTSKESKSYKKQEICHICKKGFSANKNDKNAFRLYYKVRDYCHYTGKFRGAVQSISNLRYKTPK